MTTANRISSTGGSSRKLQNNRVESFLVVRKVSATVTNSPPLTAWSSPVASHQDVDAKVELPPADQERVLDVTADEVRLL